VRCASAELARIRATLPEPTEALAVEETRQRWERWQEGLTVRITLPENLSSLRMLLVLDNLTGHRTPSFVLWLFAHGIMSLYTPLGGSWLNLAERETGRSCPDPSTTAANIPSRRRPHQCVRRTISSIRHYTHSSVGYSPMFAPSRSHSPSK